MDQGGQDAVKWTRLSCDEFEDNAVRPGLPALEPRLLVQNTRLPYYGMCAAGDYEMMRPRAPALALR